MTTSPEPPRAALITGGTSGIGLATAQVLHSRGFAVLVTGRNPDTIAAARRVLPGDVVVLRADARSPAAADLVAAEVRQRFGALDVAFLNAGITRLTPLEELAEDAFDELFDVNVKGQLLTLQKVLPLLRDGGSVIFNGSVMADKGVPGLSVYSATKAAVLSLVRGLAAELAPRGIRVNAVSPGPIETAAPDRLGLPPEELEQFTKGIIDRLPMARWGTAGEVAQLVAFLASPAASFVTGATMVVDGGMAVA